ncbi:chemotaxis protein CheA [Clostridium cylindrosporum]|uniref:Chemotaxis protein CheA n=1 Tax=Clostridium cylindrosporum DSM 605 TaxID=1121307 RepID=A0A0J8DCN9_CLOCY|nr:chemotaxis protein CheA [Clostridium cylindrosporum]KMT22008.1 chemotaxis protein CheA [Clostridium cylindrosporum DSM 605]
MTYIFENRDLDILNSYIEEAVEYLDALEEGLLNLEANTEKSEEIINDVFRMVHSIKGGSSFLGLVCITKLSHSIENTLDSLRKKKIQISRNIIDNLIEGIDLLGGLIYDIRSKIKDIDDSKSEDNFQVVLDNEDKVDELITKIQEIVDINKNPKDIGELTIESNNLTSDDNNEISDKSTTNLHDENSVDILESDEFKNTVLKEIKDQFVEETFEHLERIESEYLVKLDKDSDDSDAMNNMFRSIHSTKGGIGVLLSVLTAVNPILSIAKNISQVTHSFESLLVMFRDKLIIFTKEMVDLSYEVVDYLKACVSIINNNESTNLPKDSILSKINKILEQGLESSDKRDLSEESTKNEVVNNVASDNLKRDTSLQSIRVNQDKIDNMMNMIGELMITKNSFMHLAKKLSIEYDIPELAKEVKEIGGSVNRISDELQNAIMSIRMIEIKNVFQKMPRIIRDVSQVSNKKINLITEGETTEIDKTIIEQISDPLVHIIRNSADHGIESSEKRRSKGKNEIGTIFLRAYNKNKYVYIEVEDDGKGIDHEEIKQKAIEKGFVSVSDANKLSKSQILSLIFIPGFSTAKKVTEISGRGVGMDVVKSNITSISGTISIDSEVDKGTKITIKLPLTLAISRGLLVGSQGQTYIIPIENVVETVKINNNNIYEFGKKHFTHLRGDVIGIEWLSRILNIGQGSVVNEELNIVIISNGVDKVGIVVDKLVSEQEFVIKPLIDYLANIPGISGSTILGDGQVVLILNAGDIMKMAAY